MNVTFDPKANAMYIYFSDKKSTKTLELRDDLLVDYAGEDMVGIEVLDVSSKVAKKDITSLTLSIPAVYA
ncbi:MAG: DUF2283 domain-containing protein [Candidatus Gottesmanbacteria bacterium]|nr:DUF2283 domain-containing protein [Candidatus Gottesmanbacteria bacterium]